MDRLETIRRELERIIKDTTAERHHQLELREQELAAAAEMLAVDPRVRAAYHQGEADALQRVQALINLQLEHLPRCSGARTVLRTLARMVGEGQ